MQVTNDLCCPYCGGSAWRMAMARDTPTWGAVRLTCDRCASDHVTGTDAPPAPSADPPQYGQVWTRTQDKNSPPVGPAEVEASEIDWKGIPPQYGMHAALEAARVRAANAAENLSITTKERDDAREKCSGLEKALAQSQAARLELARSIGKILDEAAKGIERYRGRGAGVPPKSQKQTGEKTPAEGEA